MAINDIKIKYITILGFVALKFKLECVFAVQYKYPMVFIGSGFHFITVSLNEQDPHVFES